MRWLPAFDRRFQALCRISQNKLLLFHILEFDKVKRELRDDFAALIDCERLRVANCGVLWRDLRHLFVTKLYEQTLQLDKTSILRAL
jgi:hypothetical protein